MKLAALADAVYATKVQTIKGLVARQLVLR